MSAPGSRFGLGADRRALLRSMLEDEGLGGAAARRIPRRHSDSPPPLSVAQERHWLLEQFVPGTAAYNIPVRVFLEGPVDPEALGSAIEATVRRHEILRTTFRTKDGVPVQIVSPDPQPTLQVVDLRDLSRDLRTAEVDRIADEEAHRPFDLQNGPLLRNTLLRSGEHEFTWLVTMAHIISDAWSFALFFRDVSAYYAAGPAGFEGLEEPVQYGDFSLWQREHLAASDLEPQVAHWVRVLSGPPAVLEVPRDHPRPAVRRLHGDRRRIRISEAESAELRALFSRAGCTPFMGWLAAWQALLYRYTGETDICVGSPITNRDASELESMIGLAVNVLVFRTDLTGSPSFRDLLGRVRTTALDAYANPDVPFATLVDRLRPERNLSGNPLFQVAFVLQDEAVGAQWTKSLNLPGIVARPLVNSTRTAKFDLSLEIEEWREGFVVSLEYDTELFEDATAERMLGHLRRLAMAAASAPDTTIATLPLLQPEEYQQIVESWNATERPLSEEMCIDGMFRVQAERNPGRTAVSASDAVLSYRELDIQSEELAVRLHDLGLGPGTLAAVCMQRSAAQIVAILGVLKTGAAYVPLDPNYPRERIAFALADSQAAVVLTEAALEGDLPTHPNTIVVTAEGGCSAQAIERSLSRTQDADGLAYVIYTSGSTGEPKAVEVPHRGLLNLVAWHRRTYQVTQDDCASWVASPAFDASVWEIWPYLSSGASLHVPGDDVRLSPPRLIEWIGESGITLCFLPTPMAEAFLEQEIPPEFPLRGLLTGGDRLHAIHRQTDGRAFAVYNHYGPTENAVVSTMSQVDFREQGDPPIGRPIDNQFALVLDRHQQPVPVGVPGELWVGGAGLARGYRNRPDETRERFAANPLGIRGDARVYRTGDLVRWRTDGQLDFLGRDDDQVKLRGFRIELGEIESALTVHDQVSKAVVVLRKSSNEHSRLVAYVETAEPRGFDEARLREFLAARLPDYMVPASIVDIPKIPLTRNGKVDRLALPEVPDEEATSDRLLGRGALDAAKRERVDQIERLLRRDESVADVAVAVHRDLGGSERYLAFFVRKHDRATTGTELRRRIREAIPGEPMPLRFVELQSLPRDTQGALDVSRVNNPFAPSRSLTRPRTEMERTIALLWSDLLAREEVGRSDNFFDLGGNSLLCMHFISRMDSDLGIRLEPRSLLLHNLAQIAEECRDAPAPFPAPQADPPHGWREWLASWRSRGREKQRANSEKAGDPD